MACRLRKQPIQYKRPRQDAGGMSLESCLTAHELLRYR